MQCSSHKLSTPVADNVYVKRYASIEIDDGSGIRFPTDVESPWFQSQLEASQGSYLNWRVVIQWNSLSVDDNIHIYTHTYKSVLLET